MNRLPPGLLGAACLAVWIAAAPVAAEPPAEPSRPADPDLALDASCPGRPAADALRAALPRRAPYLVLQWPRAGTTGPSCVPVARLTAIDHRGLLLTVSFVFAPSPDDAPDHLPWNQRPSPRDGPARDELRWVPDGADGLHVLVAGSPGTSREALEGVTDHLANADLSALLRLVER